MTQQATVYFTSSILDIHPHLWLHLSCLARRILLVSSWAMSCFICVGSKECSFVMCGDGTEGLASWTSSVPNIVLQHKIYITWWLNRNHAEPIEDFYVILSMMHCNVRIIISAPSIFHKSLLNNECHVLPKKWTRLLRHVMIRGFLCHISNIKVVFSLLYYQVILELSSHLYRHHNSP